VEGSYGHNHHSHNHSYGQIEMMTMKNHPNHHNIPPQKQEEFAKQFTIE